MTSLAITSEPEGLQQMCRLCLSEESLHGLWEKEDLHQWIADYLSIMVSTGDRMSQSICTICQIRITEFHHFRISCQEVQSVLQSMIEDGNIKFEEVSLISADQEQREIKSEAETGSRLDSDHSKDVTDSVERHAKVYYEEMEDDQFSVEDIKLESRIGEESESLSVDSNAAIAEQYVVTKDRVFRCEKCNTSFSARHKLMYHKRAIHGAKEFHCSTCGIEFTFRNILRKHLKSEQHLRNSKLAQLETELADKFKCDECQRTFNSKYTLIEHKKRPHGPKITCNICGDVFRYRAHFKRHVETHHRDALDQVQPLVNGVNSDDRPFKCDKCQSTFKKGHSLNWHKEAVHGPKSFECSLCDFKCSLTYILNRHMRKHSSGNG